jgi:hypothetical protein
MKSFAVTIILWLFLAVAYGQDVGSKGQIAPEITGKWCYYNFANGDEGKLSNTCVTLNADGTYEFSLDGFAMIKMNSIFPGTSAQQTDYGNWWVDGSRIYYSSSLRGQGSFQFQKVNQPTDKSVPMIVLNGLSFISPTPRDAW